MFVCIKLHVKRDNLYLTTHTSFKSHDRIRYAVSTYRFDCTTFAVVCNWWQHNYLLFSWVYNVFMGFYYTCGYLEVRRTRWHWKSETCITCEVENSRVAILSFLLVFLRLLLLILIFAYAHNACVNMYCITLQMH